MTRFWITLEQGVDFVINSIERMRGGEIFIPKIPSTRIVDLAKTLAPKAKIKVIGIRSGEKINEILLTPEEARHTKEFDEYFIIEPEFPFWNKKNHVGGKALAEGFNYSSDKNTKWLGPEDIKKILKNIK